MTRSGDADLDGIRTRPSPPGCQAITASGTLAAFASATDVLPFSGVHRVILER
jgi:hypothetical protein